MSARILNFESTGNMFFVDRTDSGVVVRIARKVDSFLNLPRGWHYGEGEPPALHTVNTAKEIINFFGSIGFTRIDAFPGLLGEVMITGYAFDHCLEFIIETDGRISLAHEMNGEECYARDNLLQREAKTEARRIAGRIWNSYDYSTLRTLIRDEADSSAWLSATQPGAGSQLFIESA